MYTVKNISEIEHVLLLTDHSTIWNGRIHVPIKPGDSVDIGDDQLSIEIQDLEDRGFLSIVDNGTDKEEIVVEEKELVLAEDENKEEKVTEKELCNECGGTGEVLSEDEKELIKCEYCDGTGELE